MMNRLMFATMFVGMALNATTFVQVAQPAQRARGGGSRLPQVGTILPDVTVFDGEGNEFSTKTLREHYSVLVFGCLT